MTPFIALRHLAICLPFCLSGARLCSQNPPAPSPMPALEELAEATCQPKAGQGVPPKARACLEQFKDRVGPWLGARLSSLGEGSTSELGRRLSQELDSEAAKSPAPAKSFWHPLRFQVETPEAHPELLAVTAHFGIDATRVLFQRGADGWKRLWQDRAPVYSEIDGAFGSYRAVQTPKNPEGSYFLAAARITPWYQSHWRGAELRVFQVGTDGTVRLIGRREEGVFLGVENPMGLRVEDAQKLVFRVHGASCDPARHSFPRVFHLRLGPGGLQRVPPYADSPLDLVDEWLSLPWAEAMALVEPSGHSKWKALHARLSDHDENLLSFDEEAPKADPSTGIWAVRVDLERDEKLESYVFRIGKIGAELRILDIQRPKP